MHRQRQPYVEQDSTSTKWVILFVVLSILAHVLIFLVLLFCAKHLPTPKLAKQTPQTPEVSLSLMPAPQPLAHPSKPKPKLFLPTSPDAEAKPNPNTPIESDNNTRLKSENHKARDPNSMVPDVTGDNHHTLDLQNAPEIQSKPTPAVAPAPPTPKADQPQKPTPPQPPKPEEAKAQQPPPPNQPKAPVAPKPTPAPPKPPTPQVATKPPLPQVDPETGLPVLPPIIAPTMAPQTPNNPNQQQRKATAASPPPSFQLDKSDVQGNSGLNGPNSVAANATPLGRYMAKLYRAVGSRWHSKVDAHSDLMPVGIVRIQYTVSSDGTVTTRVLDGGNSTMQTLLSISINSIHEAAPFDPFSPELIKQVGTSFTDEFSFTVY